VSSAKVRSHARKLTWLPSARPAPKSKSAIILELRLVSIFCTITIPTLYNFASIPFHRAFMVRPNYNLLLRHNILARTGPKYG